MTSSAQPSANALFYKDKASAQATQAKWGKYGIWLVLALTFLAFANAIGNDFVNWDDDTYLVKNPVIKDLSWEGIKRIFTVPIGEYNIYRPLIYLGYAVEYALWGLNPKGYHLTSILLHLACVFFTFRFIKLLTNQVYVALFTALFFAIHPMRVESVTWILARVDPQYGLFFLLGLINYLYYRSKEQRSYLVYAFIWFALSLLSKPSAVVFPVVLVLIDYWQQRQLTARMIIEKVPFFLASLAFGLFTVKVQSGTAGDFSQFFSLVDRFFIVCYALSFYIYTSLVPYPLSILNNLPNKVDGLLPTIYYFSPLVPLLVGALVFYFKNYRREIIFCLATFVVHLGLVIQIIPYGQAVVADRYTYLPHISLFLLLFWAMQEWGKHKPNLQGYFYTLIAATTLTFMGLTFFRNQIWRNSFALWSDAIAKNPNYYLPYAARGNYHYERGNYAAALPDFEKAVSFEPKSSSVYSNMGLYYYNNRQYMTALKYFLIAIKFAHKDGEVFYNLGNTYYMLQDYAQAVKAYDKAILLIPTHPMAHQYRGLCHLAMQNATQGCADLQKAADLGNVAAAENKKQFCK